MSWLDAKDLQLKDSFFVVNYLKHSLGLQSGEATQQSGCEFAYGGCLLLEDY